MSSIRRQLKELSRDCSIFGMGSGLIEIDFANLSGRLAFSGASFTGFTLVFLGNAISTFNSYDKISQDAVRYNFRRRGGLALAGFMLAVIGVICAVSFQIWPAEGLVWSAVWSLAASITLVSVAAIWSYIAAW